MASLQRLNFCSLLLCPHTVPRPEFELNHDLELISWSAQAVKINGFLDAEA